MVSLSYLLPLFTALSSVASACNKTIQFDCEDGFRCIPRTWLCDKHVDCSNGKDEDPVRCSYIHTCHVHQFPCRKECVSRKFRCDGHKDCEDGEDELLCNVKAKDCLKDTRSGKVCQEALDFYCQGGPCLKLSKVCDGVKDCSGGEDELECLDGGKQCAQDFLRCDNKKACVHEVLLCDGNVDCQDRSDESSCHIMLKYDKESDKELKRISKHNNGTTLVEKETIDTKESIFGWQNFLYFCVVLLIVIGLFIIITCLFPSIRSRVRRCFSRLISMFRKKDDSTMRVVYKDNITIGSSSDCGGP